MAALNTTQVQATAKIMGVMDTVKTWQIPEQPYVSASLLVAFIVFVSIFFSGGDDSNEPPSIPQRYPLVGHMFGIYFRGSSYFVKIAKKYKHSMYSLKVPGGKVYVANTPETLSSIDRNPKSVAFGPMAAHVISRLSGLSSPSQKALMENLTGDNWLDGYMNAVLKEIHATLAPGPNLDKINRSVAKDLTAAINALAGKTTRVELLEWFRHQFSLSSTNAMYGPHNPFKDRKVEDGFWAFDYGVSNLLISPKPSVTCPKGDKGRKDAWDGFIKYFENKYHEQGSAMVKARYRIAAERGIPDDDIGRLEVTMIIGVLTNTVPAGFWMVFYIWTDPEILAQLCEEVGKVVVERTDADGTPLRVLSMVDLKNSCPLLNGAFSETLRMRTCGISSRVVTQDVVINKEYLLKQGSVVELPNHVTHSEPELWGPTVDQFLPRRFVKGMNADLKQPKGAYRPFGSGASLCAGRHQATSQLVSALALLVMGFEFKPVQGDWKYPGSHGHTIAAAMDSPDHDIQVEITPRKGYENVRWLLQAEPIA